MDVDQLSDVIPSNLVSRQACIIPLSPSFLPDPLQKVSEKLEESTSEDQLEEESEDEVVSPWPCVVRDDIYLLYRSNSTLRYHPPRLRSYVLRKTVDWYPTSAKPKKEVSTRKGTRCFKAKVGFLLLDEPLIIDAFRLPTLSNDIHISLDRPNCFKHFVDLKVLG